MATVRTGDGGRRPGHPAPPADYGLSRFGNSSSGPDYTGFGVFNARRYIFKTSDFI